MPREAEVVELDPLEHLATLGDPRAAFGMTGVQTAPSASRQMPSPPWPRSARTRRFESVREGEAAGHLTSGSDERDQGGDVRRRARHPSEVEAEAIHVGVASPVDDDLVPAVLSNRPSDRRA
jgi:hypothetical protein